MSASARSVLALGFVGPPDLLEHVAQVVLAHRIVRERDRAAEHGFGFLELAEICLALADLDQRLLIVADHVEVPLEIRQRLPRTLQLLQERAHLVDDVRVGAVELERAPEEILAPRRVGHQIGRRGLLDQQHAAARFARQRVDRRIGRGVVGWQRRGAGNVTRRLVGVAEAFVRVAEQAVRGAETRRLANDVLERLPCAVDVALLERDSRLSQHSVCGHRNGFAPRR